MRRWDVVYLKQGEKLLHLLLLTPVIQMRCDHTVWPLVGLPVCSFEGSSERQMPCRSGLGQPMVPHASRGLEKDVGPMWLPCGSLEVLIREAAQICVSSPSPRPKGPQTRCLRVRYPGTAKPSPGLKVSTGCALAVSHTGIKISWMGAPPLRSLPADRGAAERTVMAAEDLHLDGAGWCHF